MMYSVKDLRVMLDEKKIGAAELAEEYLKKISEKDKDINSYISVCKDEALSQAHTAQKMIDEGKISPVTGIPFSIKDNICTKGIKTTCASKMLEDFIPVYDASVISRLKDNGAVILGKTNMDEFAMGGSSQTSYFGGVKNPFDTSCVTGGSSGGAAASVSAGLCAAALGSDTGGSVRQPAAFCGVCGIKPTYGAVSRYGLIAFASSLDQIGVIASSAEDCGIILSQIAGYDYNDGTSKKGISLDYTSKVGMNIKGVKIGLPEEFFADGIEENVKKAVLDAAEVYRSMGAELVSVSLPSLKYAVSAYYLISSAEAASNLSRYDGIKFGYRSDKGSTFNEVIANTRREGFGSEVKRRILLGNYALSSGYYDAYYNNASKIRTRIKREYSDIFEKCDFILTPTAPTTAYKIGSMENDPVKMYLADVCTVTVNIAGLPAMSVPCGYDADGMPIGMSIIGKAFDESGIIALCSAYESNFDRREAGI